jgi:uncharacterized protein
MSASAETLTSATPPLLRGATNGAWALLAVVPAASIGAASALWLWPGPVGQTIFAICKIWLLAGPVLWLILVDRAKPSVSRPAWPALRAGLFLGVAIAASIVIAHLLLPKRLIKPESVIAMAHKNHLDIWWCYVAFAVFESFGNSLMEEYVWRWFVCNKAALIADRKLATLISALLFTVHHIIALSAYFNWKITLLASAGVFLGGIIWSTLYLRYRSIWPCYASHVVVDLAVFGAGAWIIFGH